jgi:phosphoglycolate phosphatase
MMKTKAILFDKDGTLLNFDAFWISLAKAAMVELFDSLQVEFPEREVMESIGVKDGKTDINGVLVHGTYGDMAEVIHPILVRGGYQGTVTEVRDMAADLFPKLASAGEILPDCEDLRGVLEQLRNAGMTLAVVTSDTPDMTEKCLEELGVSEYFTVIYSDDGVLPNKPDPYCAEKFCRDFGFDKSEVVMVGDTMTDMNFAKNAGIRGIGIAKDEACRGILSAVADKIIHDLGGLYAALSEEA